MLLKMVEYESSNYDISFFYKSIEEFRYWNRCRNNFLYTYYNKCNFISILKSEDFANNITRGIIINNIFNKNETIFLKSVISEINNNIDYLEVQSNRFKQLYKKLLFKKESYLYYYIYNKITGIKTSNNIFLF